MQRLVSEAMHKITPRTVEITKLAVDRGRSTVRRLVALCHQAGRLSVPQGEYVRRKCSWLPRAFLGALITLVVIPSADVRRAVSAPPIGHELILHSVEDGAGPPELTQIPDWFCEGDQDGDEVG
jgi:hypothetical protein